jgi:hypothetical protein
VEEHPEGNIFHTPEIYQVFQRTKGFLPELWATTDTDDNILALLLPVRVELGSGLTRFFTTRAIVYGSVLYDHSPVGEEALAVLLDAYVHTVDRDVLFTELRNQSDLSRIQATLNSYQFIYEDHLNYRIDLNRSLDELISGMGRRTRKHIRRGLRRGEVVIEEARRPDQISQCYEILRQTYSLAQVPLADGSLFEATFNVLYPLGMVKFLLAMIDGTCVAASVELLYKEVIYGWYGGTNREYTPYSPNELLIWNILQWGAENGYRVYDFGGAGKPDEPYGVRNFKAKFGGELVSYGRNTCYHAPRRLTISKIGYQIYRRFKN